MEIHIKWKDKLWIMNSRERVLLSLKHQEPDRVPVDLGGTRSSNIMGIAYNKLKKYLEIEKGETRIYDIAQQLAEPEETILNLFQVDAVDMSRTLPPAVPSDIDWESWILPDGSPAKVPSAFSASATAITVTGTSKSKGKVGLVPDDKGGWMLREGDLVRLVMPKGGMYFDDVFHPLEKAESKKDIDVFFEGSYDQKVSWPPLLTEEDATSLRMKSKYLHDNTSYAILGGFGGNFLETGEYLRGYKNYLVDLIRRKELIIYLQDKLVEYFKLNLKVWLDSVKDYIQIGVFGDDLGQQGGPLISPQIYHEMIQPYEKELYRYVKRSSDLYVFFHSCGSLYALLPDIIDAGVDIINPVQISAKDMEPTKLKREFGDDLTFWGGGVDTQRVLGFGSPQEVSKNVRTNIEAFAPGGGFVFATVHNILSNVPPQNIMATFDTVKKYGSYKS